MLPSPSLHLNVYLSFSREFYILKQAILSVFHSIHIFFSLRSVCDFFFHVYFKVSSPWKATERKKKNLYISVLKIHFNTYNKPDSNIAAPFWDFLCEIAIMCAHSYQTLCPSFVSQSQHTHHFNVQFCLFFLSLSPSILSPPLCFHFLLCVFCFLFLNVIGALPENVCDFFLRRFIRFIRLTRLRFSIWLVCANGKVEPQIKHTQYEYKNSGWKMQKGEIVETDAQSGGDE